MKRNFTPRALCVICLLLGTLPVIHAAGPVDNPPPPLVAGAEHTILYDEAFVLGFRFYRLDDGTWYVGLTPQMTTDHMDPRKLERLAVVSTDAGRSWQRTDRQVLNPQFQSKPGRWVEVATKSWRYDVPARRPFYEAQGLEVRDTPDGQIAYSQGAYVRISNDNGVTWTTRDLEIPPQALLAGYRDDRSFVRLDSRTIMRAIYSKPVARIRYYETWMLRSEDDGETWSFGQLAANVEEDASHGETAIVEAANGDIVAMMRSEPALGTRMWVSRSSDRGKTWSKAEITPLHGHPAHLLRLRDGRLLCTYGVRDKPVGMRACISRDNGRTWSADDIVVLRTGEDFNRNSGYPITREADDGTLLTVYYLTRGDKASVELTRWRPTWKK